MRELPGEELRKHLEEIREELFNLRFQAATGQLENYKRLGQARRDIAKALTILNERALGIEQEPTGDRERPKARASAREPSPQEPEEMGTSPAEKGSELADEGTSG